MWHNPQSTQHTCYKQVTGNTFSGPFNPEFGPKVKLSATSVSFPPLSPGQAGHQTVAVVNYGDTPVGAARAGFFVQSSPFFMLSLQRFQLGAAASHL